MNEVKLYLEGLNCAGCAGKIEEKTNKLPEVKEASLNFTTKALVFELEENSDEEKTILDIKKIVKKLEPDVVVTRDKVKESNISICSDNSCNISKKEIEVLKLNLIDLNCAGCAGKIEEKTNKLSEVKEASLNFSTKTMNVEINDSKDLEKVKTKIKEIVFKLEPDVKVEEVIESVNEEVVTDTQKKKAKSESGFSAYNIIRFILGVVLFGVAEFAPFAKEYSTAIFVVSYIVLGYPTVYKALKNIFRAKNIFDENFLMMIASIGAFLIGEHSEAVAVIMFYEIGEMFQHYAVNNSRKSISALMDIKPDFARVIRNGIESTVSPYAVKVGEIITVRAGERIPLDGVVIEGNGSIDTSAITGESVPRSIKEESEVLAGCIDLNSVIKLRVNNDFKESTLSKILDLVENAGNKKAPTEKFITKFSRYYTPVVVIIAVLLAIVPPLVIPDATFNEWLRRSLVFLVVSCPCALVVSIPLGFFGGIGAASRSGILVKGGNYLEALNNVKTVVFDKTGTLTEGKFEVLEIESKSATSEELLEIAAYSEYYSNHPIAKSILAKYTGVVNEDVIKSYEEIAGRGIALEIKDDKVLAGNAKLMSENDIKFEEINKIGTIIYFAVNGEYIGNILIGDKIKEDSKESIKRLKKLGIKTVMLTGDNKNAGEAVGKELGLDKVYAQLLPQDKVTELEKIMDGKGQKDNVVFVGDGINDAPVLARADIGIAMGGVGSDAAVEAADVVIMKDEPSKIIEAIKIAKRTRRIVIQNIVFALGVKAIILVLGALGIATMWEAVFGDVGVAIIAILNSMRVLTKK